MKFAAGEDGYWMKIKGYEKFYLQNMITARDGWDIRSAYTFSAVMSLLMTLLDDATSSSKIIRFYTIYSGISTIQPSPTSMAMHNLKLGVDVVSAHNLLPKDGQGYLDPFWNESFYFNISDPSNLHNLTLDAYIYNNVRATQSRSFLGKVCLNGTSFVPYSDAVVLHYPLEKRGIFSRVRGELGLKVYITDDPSIKSSHPLQEAKDTQIHTESVQDPVSNTFSNAKTESRHTFHHLPNPNHTQQQGQQHSPAVLAPHQVTKYGVDEMKAEPQPPKLVRMYSAASAQPVDSALKETSPFLGGGRVVGGRVIRTDNTVSTYDLVEQMHFLFARVVKARDLPAMDITGSLDPGKPFLVSA
ncbi:hypothetical protein RJ640_018887 [Escallonia rubra]|uniref:C2 domain-containing protein n=1 Tax=Escallonia rubra TaxID=112253 RepID=A0AA88UPW2_9ASTE|nr:hypothetical protein RJ640_018887 [Escallonia rubra]